MATNGRKRRNDRNHVIYRVHNMVTGEFYIGLTVCTHGVSYKGLSRACERRLQKHFCRAFTEESSLPLSINMREHGKDAFLVEPLWIVRGKANAHEVEREVVADMNPSLNVCLV